MITYCHFHGAVETNHTTMYAAIATNVTLKCNIEPNVIMNTYRWRREDNSPLIRVGNVNHYIMRNQNNTILSLVITNVKKTDFGTYICDWQTHSGIKQQKIELGM